MDPVTRPTERPFARPGPERSERGRGPRRGLRGEEPEGGGAPRREEYGAKTPKGGAA